MTKGLIEGELTEERFINAFVERAVQREEEYLKESGEKSWKVEGPKKLYIEETARKLAKQAWDHYFELNNAVVVSEVPDNYAKHDSTRNEVTLYREKISRFTAGRRAKFLVVFSPEFSKIINGHEIKKGD